jgi:hypothetical protein
MSLKIDFLFRQKCWYRELIQGKVKNERIKTIEKVTRPLKIMTADYYWNIKMDLGK